MSLRVNTNVSAINTHRNLTINNTEQSKSMERLSSGMKINRGADGPASLVISERLRSQTAGLKQAIDNSEAGISLVQTAEAALDEVSSALITARQLAVHAANEAVNDDVMLRADQQEIDNILATVNRIAQNTQYGTKTLLDGSKGATGVVSGANLEFVGATQATQSSGATGYDVSLNQAARRAQMAGTVELTNDIIDLGEQLTITEGSKTVNFKTIQGETVENNLNALNAAIKEAGLNIDLMRPSEKETSANTPQIISLRHKEFGSEHSFKVSSTTQGLLSTKGDVYDTIANGLDVAGEINGEEATGRGQVLTGNVGNANTDGLAIRYSGEALPGEPNPANVPDSLEPAVQPTERDLGNLAPINAGTVTLAQNSLVFQIGSNAEQTSSLALRNMRTNSLGTGVENVSSFQSLADIDVTGPIKAQDSMRVLDRALEEVSSTRGEIGAFQKNNLESNLNYLRIAHENVMSSESVIRDADMAEEMTKFTRNQIMVESSTAMLAQANSRSQSVLRLLNG
jgi:flagellin